jgi:tetratricopeptide (TPR) repeat protein
MAYWYENDNQYDQANNLYKTIIGEQPDYIDAFLRLAYLARKRGDTHRALFWIDEASKSKARAPVNQHCLKGKLLFDLGKVQEAGLEFKYVLERIVRDDSYSFLGLANITYKQALAVKDNNNGEQDRLLVKAYNKYLEILNHD